MLSRIFRTWLSNSGRSLFTMVLLKVETKVLMHQDVPQRHDLSPGRFWIALSH
jgi:hypothetical protein